MSWAAKYVGIPYLDFGRDAAGADCWGLSRLIWKNELGIEMPSYGEVSPAELEEVEQMVKHGAIMHGWRRVRMGQEFDAVIFRRGRFDSHIGVMCDGLTMIHCDRRAGSACVERVDSGRWADTLVGFYRHESRQ